MLSAVSAAHAPDHNTRRDLADKSGVAAVTIKGFELLGADSKISTLNKWRRALESAGVEFIDDGAKSDEGGPSVRLTSAKGSREGLQDRSGRRRRMDQR
jgi:hypothetical protein